MNEMRKLMESLNKIAQSKVQEEIKSGIPGGRPFIDLSGPGGNAFAIMGHAKSYAEQLGLDGDAIVNEMQKGDYENLLSVFNNYFGDYVDLYRGDSEVEESEETIGETFGDDPDPYASERSVRQATNKLHELMDEGIVDPRAVADAALKYMSEDDVADMAHINDLIYDDDVDEFEESVEIVGENRYDDLEDVINQLSDIKEQISGLVYDAASLVEGTNEEDSAKAYWIGHILGALDNESEYGGGSMTTMQDTIDALGEGENFEDDDDDIRRRRPETDGNPYGDDRHNERGI